MFCRLSGRPLCPTFVISHSSCLDLKLWLCLSSRSLVPVTYIFISLSVSVRTSDATPNAVVSKACVIYIKVTYYSKLFKISITVECCHRRILYVVYVHNNISEPSLTYTPDLSHIRLSFSVLSSVISLLFFLEMVGKFFLSRSNHCTYYLFICLVIN